MSYLCPNCNSFTCKTTFGGSLLERSTPAGGARFVEKSTTGSNQTGFWWCKQAKVLIMPRCGNFIDALKLLANHQED